MTVRAGSYAEVQGVVYSCRRGTGSRVVLVVSGDPSAPEGFERRPNGSWEREIDRSMVDRLFHVNSEATWEGREVNVRAIRGEVAHLWSPTTDPPGRPEVVRDRTSWEAWVPLTELRDVVQESVEVSP